MTKTKVCTKCNETKHLTEFHKRASSKDGHTSQCKSCGCTQALAHYYKTREQKRSEHNARARAWYHQNSDRSRENFLKRAYGITLAEYDIMLKAQSGSCAICGKTSAGEEQRLSVDHNHKTNRVRGLLCADCNRALGGFQDSPTLLRRAANYIEQSE